MPGEGGPAEATTRGSAGTLTAGSLRRLAGLLRCGSLTRADNERGEQAPQAKLSS